MEPIDRDRLARFLWNMPMAGMTRFRYRVIAILMPNGRRTSFLLEHVFISEKELCLFVVKSFDPDLKLRYSMSINDRENENKRLIFMGLTQYVGDAPFLHEYKELVLSNVLSVAYDSIMDYAFLPSGETSKMFSIHVEFYV